MGMDIQVKGIAKKWFFNMFLIVACAVVLFVAVFCVFFSGYYNERARSLAASYANEFSTLSMVQPESFGAMAREYVEYFQYKDKIEVQIINSTGRVIATTTGFETNQDTVMPDYEAALKSPDGKGSYQGKINGEKVVASTEFIDTDSGRIGAIRWIFSTSELDRHILTVQLVVITVGIAMLTITFFSGMYFLSSIIKPLHEVSDAARKIAMGDFNATLTVNGKNEISELCDSINYMASELKHAESMKNDFISSVSHELRTPLTAIRGWGETAKMSLGYDDELVGKGLDVVLSESERLSGLVEELLDFSRMQNGRLKVEMNPIKVSDILSDAVDMYVELARQQRKELLYMPLKVEEPFILGDVNRLKQVFINVIDNAVKYTEDGGQIIVQMQLDEGCVTVKVRDTGVGIPAQDIDRVKEKFFKSNKVVRGSGIGLAVADEIMKQHNGLLFLASTEGVGTTVTIVLPVFDVELTPENKEPAVTLDEAAENAVAQVVAEVAEAAQAEIEMKSETDAKAEETVKETEQAEETSLQSESENE